MFLFCNDGKHKNLYILILIQQVLRDCKSDDEGQDDDQRDADADDNKYLFLHEKIRKRENR